EGGAAGARTPVDQASPAAEAALVPESAALAGRLRSHHQHLEAFLLDAASHLQRRAWISALRGLVCDYQESVFHRSLSSASEEPWSGRLMPLPNDASCWARLHVWLRSPFSERSRKLTAPADERAVIVREMDPSMVRI